LLHGVWSGAGGGGFASGGYTTPGNASSSERFRGYFAFRHSVVIEICSALHPPYPADDDNAAIFRIMPSHPQAILSQGEIQTISTVALQSDAKHHTP